MHFITKTDRIQKAVQMAERITGKKESLPILSCVLIEAGKECVLRATNLEAGIEATIPADVKEKGVIAVPATILSQTLRSITVDTVELKSEEGNLLITSRGSKTLIKAIPHSEFPTLPSVESTAELSVARERILEGIQAVMYAASPSMIRPDLGSISLSIGNGKIVCVATDSFRLAEKTIVEGKAREERDLLVPLKHAGEIAHILERIESDAVTLGSDDVQLAVAGDGVRYVSRIVDATFPNYKEIIPKSFVTEATILKSDFNEMLRKARVFAGTDQHVGIHVYPKKKVFSATARSNDVGEMSDTVDAALSGEDLDINFHIGYLAECLTTIQSESIVLQFAGVGRPLVIKGVSDATFLYLVMPLNR